MTPGVARFGIASDGRAVDRIVIGAGDLSAAVLTWGAALQDVRLAGVPHSLTVGSPNLAAYEADMRFCGTLVGPVANRIGGARAMVDGTACRFEANEGGNTLHSGSDGVHARHWDLVEATDERVVLALELGDGEGGFPGNRRIVARFAVAAPAALSLTLAAETDAPTLMNLANHGFWRLGEAETTVGHRLTVHAERHLPTGPDLLPTGEVAAVEGTRFDYRDGRVLEAGAEGPLDLNFCLSEARGALRPAARIEGPGGLAMEMATTEPGLQVFDGSSLELPGWAGHDGRRYRAYAGVALEAQSWPDAPNWPEFPSIIVRPGEPWRQVTRWAFGACPS